MLRRLLEPFAVLYEKAIVAAGKEPSEVRLKAQHSAVYPAEANYGTETVHIIGGESLQVIYEVWKECRRIELAKHEQCRAALNALSAPERAWLEWFYSLSGEDQEAVELCGEKYIAVTPDNFEDMKKIARELDDDDLHSELH